MAVALAAGATPKMTLNPLESIQTMTAYIVQVSQGDTPAGTLEYHTIFAVGLTLFTLTLVLNVFAQWILNRSAREVRMSISEHSDGRPYAKFASELFAWACGFCTFLVHCRAGAAAVERCELWLGFAELAVPDEFAVDDGLRRAASGQRWSAVCT